MEREKHELKARLVWRVVDDEALIVDLDSGGFFSLDPIGTEIWQSLHEGLSVAQIVEAIVVKYGVDAPTAQQDVAELLDDLSREGLVD